MAIVQISKIQQRSGNLVDLPQLDNAEFGWASDAKRLFIGKTSPNENIEVLTAYSQIAFSQIDGSVGNLDISNVTIGDGQVLTYDGDNWVNRGGDAGGLITLGDASNVKIDGGGVGYVLTTDGTGNLSWAPKSTLVARIQNVTKADPAVVTTVTDNFFNDGAQVTIVDPQGMTQLGGNVYYANVINSTQFELYHDSGLANTVDSTGYSNYAFTSVSATTVTTNVITVGNAAVLTVGEPVRFVGSLSTSGIQNNVTYYVATASGTSLQIATSGTGNLIANIVPLQTTTGLTANVYQEGGLAVSSIGSGASLVLAGGTDTQVQYNDGGVLNGSSTFTWNNTTKLLTVNGNANVGNIIATGLANATRFISNIATGTTPIQVVSTTRVPNLNVSYANVSDFGVVTAQTTGTFYPVFVNGNTTANYALASNANISFNAATGLLTASRLTSTGNANVGNLGTAGLIVATGNVTGGNLVTGGVLSVTGNANVGNLGTTGNITAANVIANLFGNGAAINSLTGANVTGEVDFAAVANSVAVANVVGIGNIAVIDIDGNASNILYGNGDFAAAPILYSNSNVATFLAAFGSNTISTTGNANVGNLNSAAQVVATGNVTGGNIVTSGVVSATGNVTGGNLTTGGMLDVTGDANVSGNINATGNINVSANVVVVGNTNVTNNVNANNLGTGNYANVGLDLNVSRDASIIGNASVNGNITTSGNVSANYLTLTNTANIGANINVTGNSVVTGNSNVTGYLTVGGTTTLVGDVNISGNIDVTSTTVSMGSVNNLKIIGGSAGYVLSTDGTGNLSFISPAASPAGSNTQVQYNNNGGLGATPGFTFNSTTGSLAVPGSISASQNLSGSVLSIGTSAIFGTTVSVGTNLTVGGNSTTTGNISVGANATVSGRLNVTNNITTSSGSFVGSGAGLTNVPGASVTGKVANAIYADNAGSTGYAATSGNITGAGIISITNGGTASSTVLGAGQNLGIIGWGQTWQDITLSRGLGVTYTNTAGRPIMVYVRASWTLSFNTSMTGLVGGTEVAYFNAHSAGGTVSFLVPPNAGYSVFVTSGANVSLANWTELR